MAGSVRDESDDPPKSVLLQSVWRARWAVLVAALVAGAAGYLVSAQQAETYAAGSRVVLSPTEDFHPLGTPRSPNDPTRYVANQAAIVGTAPVLEAAADALADGSTARSLAEALNVEITAESDVMTVVATAPTADRAAARSNEIVAAYRDFVRRSVDEAASAAVDSTTDPIVAGQIRTQAAVYGDGVAVVEQAEVPASPVTPRPLRNALVLAVIAALLAMGIAIWRPPASKTVAALGHAAQTRVLGAVPVLRTGRAARSPAAAEDFSLALVSLQYVARDDTTVLVTGATRASSSAAVVDGLAVAAAARHRRVLVIDAEPETRDYLRVSGSRLPERTLDQLISVRVPQTDVLATVQPGTATSASIHVALVGGTDTRGAVETEDLAHAIAELQKSFDLVLLHVAPVQESPLAFSLLRHAAAVVTVVGREEKPEVLLAQRDRLAVADRPLRGLIVTVHKLGRRKSSRNRRPVTPPPAPQLDPERRVNGTARRAAGEVEQRGAESPTSAPAP